MKVLVDGTAGLYMQTGRFQLYATNMEKEGAGELYQRFLELKEKLTA